MVDQLRNGRVNQLSSDVGDIKVAIGKMDEKLDNIVENMRSMKLCDEETQRCLHALNLDLASRPSSKEVKDTIKKVEQHDTFFMILGAAITIISIKILGWMDKLFS